MFLLLVCLFEYSYALCLQLPKLWQFTSFAWHLFFGFRPLSLEYPHPLCFSIFSCVSIRCIGFPFVVITSTYSFFRRCWFSVPFVVCIDFVRLFFTLPVSSFIIFSEVFNDCFCSTFWHLFSCFLALSFHVLLAAINCPSYLGVSHFCLLWRRRFHLNFGIYFFQRVIFHIFVNNSYTLIISRSALYSSFIFSSKNPGPTTVQNRIWILLYCFILLP